MRAKIAIATVSGKAYYKLVRELKERNLIFLSLLPSDKIPQTVKVVLTTREERDKVDHPNVLVYDAEEEPTEVIDEAIRIIQGKRLYEDVTIGVDTGKTFGVAIICDGNVLRAEDGLTLEKAIDMIITALKENPARNQTVRIGGGVPTIAEELLNRLNRALPESVKIEIVDEVGTSRIRSEEGRKKLTDADSAIRIAKRRRTHETSGQGG